MSVRMRVLDPIDDDYAKYFVEVSAPGFTFVFDATKAQLTELMAELARAIVAAPRPGLAAIVRCRHCGGVGKKNGGPGCTGGTDEPCFNCGGSGFLPAGGDL